MTTLTNYVDYITIKFQEILRNDLYALSKGEQKNSYHLKDWKLCSINEKKEHLSALGEFLDNLKSYIKGDGQLNFIYDDNVNLYYDFSRDIFKKLFYDNPFENRDKQPESPTVDELIKVVSLFKKGTIRVDALFDETPRGLDINGKDYSDFLLFLMTIPNKHLFEDKKYINNHISHEISTFTGYFYQETDLKVKDAFNTYLANRKSEFKKINDSALEERLFHRIKKSLAPKYWSKMVNYFPNLVEQDKGIVRDNLVESDDVKVYQVNFNKGAFYKLCPSIVDSENLRVAFNFIHSMIVSTKPEEISIMQSYELDHDIKITFSGKDIDESYKQKVAKIYRLVAEEYNSDNIVKYDPKVDDKKNNITYLRKVSEMHWLEVMLENSSTNKNKKMKM